MEIPHIDLNLELPIECSNELLQIKDFYGLKLNENINWKIRNRYFTTSLGHALRSYSPFKDEAYYTKESKSLLINKEYDDGTFINTSSWKKCPKTTSWIIQNLCDENDLGMVCLHKIVAGGWVDWHSHLPCDMKIIHFSLITNENDLSEVQMDNKIYSLNYPERKGYIFNSNLQHRSTNFSNHDRVHLVIECKKENGKLKSLHNQ